VERLPVRYLRVTGTERTTPRMARVWFRGDDLAGFTVLEPDQQVKLYFPKPGQAVPRLPEPAGDFAGWYRAFAAIPGPEQPWTRSYTISVHDTETGRIAVDFVLHGGDDAGPATRWARSARPGDTLGMFGPSSIFARPVPLTASIEAAGWLLIAGDETALPAIRSLLGALPEGARAVAWIEVPDDGEEQPLPTRGDATVRWLHRNGVPAGHSTLLLDAVRAAEFPPGKAFSWLAAESGTVRALRRHLVDERGLPKSSIDFTGHWRLRLTQDDAPTEADLAEARERLADAQSSADSS
jgi:NADPH-dependent ferric siderophore reductase